MERFNNHIDTNCSRVIQFCTCLSNDLYRWRTIETKLRVLVKQCIARGSSTMTFK